MRDPLLILTKMKAIFEATKMLEVDDKHRMQAVQNLGETLDYTEKILKEIGILEDFKFILNAIKNISDPAAVDFTHL